MTSFPTRLQRSNVHRLKPSAVERQIVRVQFLTPEGDPEQLTISSSWEMPGYRDAFYDQDTPEAKTFVATLQHCPLLEGQNCEIVNVELLGTGMVEDLC